MSSPQNPDAQLLPVFPPGPPPSAGGRGSVGNYQPAYAASSRAPEQYASQAFSPAPAAPPPAPRPVMAAKHNDFAMALLAESTMRSFAMSLTLFLCIMFAVPIFVMYNLGRDPQVKYWITRNLWAVLILPLIFAGVHVLHVIRGRPSRIMAVLCTIGSCSLLLYFADVVLMGAYQSESTMKAKDCDTFAEKRMLENEWQSARSFYDKCMQDTAANFNATVVAATENYRIQDCKGYEDAVAKHPQWNYLAATEGQHRCSGWCTFGEALWTFHHTRDSCSVAVGQHMVDTVQRTMWKVTAYTLTCFICASAMLLTVGSFLGRNGIEW